MGEWKNLKDNYKDYYGFVYIIYHKDTKKYYIGKKSFWKNVRRKPLKGKKRVRLDKVESDWRNYWGSSKDFLEYVNKEGKENFVREILRYCRNKAEMSYFELERQVAMDVLRDKRSFNGIINARINKNHLKSD